MTPREDNKPLARIFDRYDDVRVYLDSDPTCWGSTATREQADCWSARLVERIRARFPGVTVLVQQTVEPVYSISSHRDCDADEAVRAEIETFINDTWEQCRRSS